MAEKRKLLIISGNYLRSNKIESIRPRKIAKYLALTGRYDVSVLVNYKNTLVDENSSRFPYDLTILENETYVKEHILVTESKSRMLIKHMWYKFAVKKSKDSTVTENVKHNIKSSKENKLNNVKILARYIIEHILEMLYYRRAKKTVSKRKLWEIDIIFSTYASVASHYIARYIKKKKPNVFWIADFRDVVYWEYDSKLFKTYAKYFTKNICKTANVITSVSQGFLDNMTLPDVPSFVITNGFDPDDAPKVNTVVNDKFTMVYTGSLYKEQDLSVLFKIILELINEKAIDITRIIIKYAGKNENDFIKWIEEYDLKCIFHSFGLVKREKSLEIQKTSDVLILASWNTSNFTGMHTGKFLEYMMMGKPIIAIINGNLQNSIVKEVIEKCSLGFCYEEATGAYDYIRLKNYIYNQYLHYIKHGTVLFEPNEEETDYYNYKNIANRLEKLFP